MAGPLPILLIPGLLVTLRLYERQLPARWRLGPVTVADHTRDATVAGPDTPEQTRRRLGQIDLARSGRFGEIADQLTRRRGRRSWPPASRGRGWSWWPAPVT